MNTVNAGPIIEELANTVRMLEREAAAQQIELLRDMVFVAHPGLYKSEDIIAALNQLAQSVRTGGS